ncbi:MAG: rod shape-determining protein MreC [Chthoniobacteraceae bacterium]|nr:rod shape-determining protein MreC [Chthoniobacteraceae bacterium]
MRRFSIFALVVFILAVGGLFALGPSGTQRVQNSFLGMITPFFKTGSDLERKITAVRQGLKTLQEVEAENKQLIVSNKELQVVNQTLRDLEAENNRLRLAMQYRERAAFQLVPARVIARDASSWWNTVKIDRGSADGVESDMPVLTESGLVGKTTFVSEHAANVLLISDENCKVASSIEGSREQGIISGERASGSSQPALCMRFLSKTANLKSGQKVYSSGVGGVYPAGVSIGAIKEFRVRELDGYATLVPAVDLTTLEDVFVVLGKK